MVIGNMFLLLSGRKNSVLCAALGYAACSEGLKKGIKFSIHTQYVKIDSLHEFQDVCKQLPLQNEQSQHSSLNNQTVSYLNQ